MTVNKYVKERNEKLAKKVITALEKRHFNAFYCEDEQAALNKILELVSKDETISWGGSVTLEQTGITQYLIDNGYKVINRDSAKNPDEKAELTRKGLLCDTFLMSSNAISEDGQLVNVDGTGNRVAALCYGPKRVIVIAGLNKVAKNIEDAVSRARNIAAPVNMQRIKDMANNNTPCVHTGSCADCLCDDSICCQIVVTRLSKPAGKINVILVNKELGY